MKKNFYSAAAAGVLLLAGTGAASAVPLIGVGPTGVEGFLSLTDFSPGATAPNFQNFTMTFDYLSGSNGGPTTLSFTSTSQPGTVDLFSNTLDLNFDASPNVEDPSDPNYKPSTDIFKLQASWLGTANVDPALANLTFGGSDSNSGLTGSQISITYNGFSLFGQSYTGVGSLLLTVTNPTDSNTITFSGVDTCTSGSLTPSNVCFTRALTLLDLDIGIPDGKIDGVFFIPEPASLALMSVGLAGLGFIRRKKAA